MIEAVQRFLYQGKFSELDSTNWTPELQRALNYDRKSALQFDNGKSLVLVNLPWTFLNKTLALFKIRCNRG